MSLSTQRTQELVARAAGGSDSATQRLLTGHRGRLRQMVQVRMDRRLSARIDPSDVVQDVLANAVRRMPQYLQTRPMPFYPWLRKLAWDHLVKLHRRHVLAQRRSVKNEEAGVIELTDNSVTILADQLAAPGLSPSADAVRNEVRQRVRDALEKLRETDRELLVMKYLEHMTLTEIAASLDISTTAAKARHVRALNRFAQCMGQDPGGR